MRGLGIGVLAAALTVAGCGGSDESDSLPDTVAEITTTSAEPGRAFSDWQEASRSTCNEYWPRWKAAVADVQAATTLDGTARELLEFVDLAVEFVERLRAIPVPTERTRAVERVHDRIDRGLVAIAAQRRNLAAGDYQDVNSQLGVLTNYADTDELYEQLDVPECVTPQE